MHYTQEEIQSGSWGVLSVANYVPAAMSRADYTTTNGGYFVFGQDFETYSGKSGQSLQGANMLGSDLYFSAYMGAMTTGSMRSLLYKMSF